MLKSLLSCSLFCAVAALPQIVEAQQKIKMPADSLVLTSTIDGKPAVAFVFAAMNAGGKTAICGAYYYPAISRASQYQKQQLREAYFFKMGSKRLGISTSHFNRINDLSAGENTSVTCKTSRVALKKGYSTERVDIKANRSQIFD